MPAKVENPRKQFQFGISVVGAPVDEFLVQKIKLPDWEVNQDEHGDSNHLIKTGGMVMVGVLNLEKISPATAPDNWVYNWIRQVQNVYTGGGDLPAVYKRVIEVFQYALDGNTIINSWVFDGVWPTKINGVDLTRVDSGNTIENIDFSVDKPDHL